MLACMLNDQGAGVNGLRNEMIEKARQEKRKKKLPRWRGGFLRDLGGVCLQGISPSGGGAQVRPMQSLRLEAPSVVQTSHSPTSRMHVRWMCRTAFSKVKKRYRYGWEWSSFSLRFETTPSEEDVLGGRKDLPGKAGEEQCCTARSGRFEPRLGW